MRGARVAAVLTGLGALVTCPAAHARPTPDGVDATAIPTAGAALSVLTTAAETSRRQVWVATEQVLSLTSGTPVVSTAPIVHAAGADIEDADLLMLLVAHYDLALSPGPVLQVVEARRPGIPGTAGVAGRFWVDRRTGLVVRRDVLDAQGRLVRRTELVGVQVGPRVVAVGETPAWPAAERLNDTALSALQAHGWLVPQALPGGLELYDARWVDGQVLQLAYSDGLSTLSLFSQRGELPAHASGVVRQVGGGDVWVSAGEPERMVWAGDGCTWTVVSDADPALIDAVVASLPHRTRPPSQEGLAPRVWRGMSRVGSWLNPFD